MTTYLETNKKQFIELHSDEMQEIINAPPNWLIRSGISVFFALLMVFIIGCYLIKYPDVIPTHFSLTAINPPRTIIVRNTGRIEKILVNDGDFVSKSQILAYIESSGDHNQILSLSKDLTLLDNLTTKNKWEAIRNIEIINYSILGEIQSEYQRFYEQFNELKSFLREGYYLQHRNLLLKDYEDLIKLEEIQTELLDLQKKDYEIAQQVFSVHEKLFNDKVIAPLDFQLEKSKLIAKEVPLKTLSTSLIQNKASQTAKQKEILESEHIIKNKKTNFLQTVHSLQSGIEDWKRRYILMASIEGKVSFSEPWQANQNVNIGQEFLSIEPFGERFRGYITLPQENLGKVKVGQNVLIKLDGYPYKEYGIIDGQISMISLTLGKDSTYWGHVELPNQLKTRYGHQLSYKSGLKGTGEIITQDRRLIQRFLSFLSRGE